MHVTHISRSLLMFTGTVAMLEIYNIHDCNFLKIVGIHAYFYLFLRINIVQFLIFVLFVRSRIIVKIK